MNEVINIAKSLILNFVLGAMFIASTLNLKAQNGFTEYSGNFPSQSTIKFIAIDNYSNKLICSNSGVHKFDGLNTVFYNTNNSGIISNVVRQVAVDNNNVYWFATDKGLCSFNGNFWTTFDTLNSTIISNNILSVYFTDNQVYIGTDRGFSIYNGSNFNNYNIANGLIIDTVNCFTQDNFNNLWVGTNMGLLKFSNGVNFTVYNTSNSGLKNNNILSLYFDGVDLWMGTKIFCLHRHETVSNTIKNISEIFDTPIVFSGSPPIRSITAGPRGGIAFGMKKGRFYEIFQKKIYVYYKTKNPDLSPADGNFLFANDFQNEQIWIVGLGSKLVSFKLANYNGYAISNTYENYKALDINEVSAAITNRGDMFWDVDIGEPNFKVPKAENKTAVFMNSLWLAGLDQNSNLHLAAQTYRQGGIDYWPGPLDTISGTTDTATVILYDKVWKINWFDIEQFKYYFSIGEVQNGTWFPTNDILTWPARGSGNYSRNLAPFIDVNHNGVYDPLHDGDFPDIKGDQMLFWLFNDTLGKHTESDGRPLQIEVQASAYAFGCPELNTIDSAINYTTFYHYKIFNRSGLDYDSCFIGNLTDFDLGYAFDDAIACKPDLDLAFCYNFDSTDFDDGSGLTYGNNPPVIGNVLLNAPTGKMNNFIAFSNDDLNAISGNPTITSHYYNYLRGLWKNNNNISLGGNGIGGSIPTHFIYSGDFEDTIPWYPSNGSDIRSLQSSGPFSFPANTSIDYDFAIVYARDTVGNNSPQLFQQLFDNATRAKTWFDDNTFPSCIGPNKVDEITNPKNELELFPNPTSNVINFKCSNKVPVLEYAIFNSMGKQIAYNKVVNTNEIYVGNFANGLYFLELKFVDGSMITNKFIKN
jgi:hypothetical protein